MVPASDRTWVGEKTLPSPAVHRHGRRSHQRGPSPPCCYRPARSKRRRSSQLVVDYRIVDPSGSNRNRSSGSGIHTDRRERSERLQSPTSEPGRDGLRASNSGCRPWLAAGLVPHGVVGTRRSATTGRQSCPGGGTDSSRPRGRSWASGPPPFLGSTPRFPVAGTVIRSGWYQLAKP